MPHAVMVPVSQLLHETPVAVELPLSCIKGLSDDQTPQVPAGDDGVFAAVSKERQDVVYSIIYTGLVSKITCRAIHKPKDPFVEQQKEARRKVTPWPRRSA